MPSLPPPRLVMTSHDADGKSVISSDINLTPSHPSGPIRSGFTIIHTNPKVPASNSTPPPPIPANVYPEPQASGTLFGTIDFAPHSESAMHRTLSLDYCVVLTGSIWLSLDGGEEVEIKAGETVVQRGTNHAWENRGDSWCRAMFVMVGSDKVTLADGKELEEMSRRPPKL